MENTEIVFHFPEHMTESEMAGLITGIAAYGNVAPGSRDRSYVVSVFRASKFPKLKELLDHNERYGFLRWHAAA